MSVVSFWRLLVDGICRPPRDENYCAEDLVGGAGGFFQFAETSGVREDMTILNRHGERLACSHFMPLHLKGADGKLPCVVYCHSNSGSRRDAEEAVLLLVPLGISVFAVDFAGSGVSDGEWVTLGANESEDLEDVVAYLRSTDGISTIALWGRSMGAVAALLYAYRDPNVAALVLDSPFSRLTDLIWEVAQQLKLPIPRYFLKRAVGAMRKAIQKRAGFDVEAVAPIEVVQHCCMPALFGHGTDDVHIDTHHCRKLHANYAGTRHIMFFGGNHLTIRPEDFYSTVALFLHRQMGVEVHLDNGTPLEVAFVEQHARMVIQRLSEWGEASGRLDAVYAAEEVMDEEAVANEILTAAFNRAMGSRSGIDVSTIPHLNFAQQQQPPPPPGSGPQTPSHHGGSDVDAPWPFGPPALQPIHENSEDLKTGHRRGPPSSSASPTPHTPSTAGTPSAHGHANIWPPHPEAGGPPMFPDSAGARPYSSVSSPMSMLNSQEQGPLSDSILAQLAPPLSVGGDGGDGGLETEAGWTVHCTVRTAEGTVVCECSGEGSDLRYRWRIVQPDEANGGNMPAAGLRPFSASGPGVGTAGRSALMMSQPPSPHEFAGGARGGAGGGMRGGPGGGVGAPGGEFLSEPLAHMTLRGPRATAFGAGGGGGLQSPTFGRSQTHYPPVNTGRPSTAGSFDSQYQNDITRAYSYSAASSRGSVASRTPPASPLHPYSYAAPQGPARGPAFPQAPPPRRTTPQPTAFYNASYQNPNNAPMQPPSSGMQSPIPLRSARGMGLDTPLAAQSPPPLLSHTQRAAAGGYPQGVARGPYAAGGQAPSSYSGSHVQPRTTSPHSHATGSPHASSQHNHSPRAPSQRQNSPTGSLSNPVPTPRSTGSPTPPTPYNPPTEPEQIPQPLPAVATSGAPAAPTADATTPSDSNPATSDNPPATPPSSGYLPNGTHYPPPPSSGAPASASATSKDSPSAPSATSAATTDTAPVTDQNPSRRISPRDPAPGRRAASEIPRDPPADSPAAGDDASVADDTNKWRRGSFSLMGRRNSDRKPATKSQSVDMGRSDPPTGRSTKSVDLRPRQGSRKSIAEEGSSEGTESMSRQRKQGAQVGCMGVSLEKRKKKKKQKQAAGEEDSSSEGKGGCTVQ